MKKDNKMFFESLKHRFNSDYDNIKNATILLEECKHLADIINTTIDENEFFKSYDKLIENFTELITYEGVIPFTNKPSSDLRSIIANKQAAIESFHRRANVRPICIEDADPFFVDAAYLVVKNQKASIGMLQRTLKIGFNRASSLLNQLSQVDIVGPENGTFPRNVLVDEPTLYRMLNNATIKTKIDTESGTVYSATKTFDTMSGLEFERFCADLLEKNGYYNVDVTQGSGDHGIDILAEKDDITYAIQCKCYSSNIGNAAVQQAHTGKSLYHKDIAVVLTNQYFTAQAQEEANALGVKLWDRDKLQDLIEKAQ